MGNIPNTTIETRSWVLWPSGFELLHDHPAPRSMIHRSLINCKECTRLLIYTTIYYLYMIIYIYIKYTYIYIYIYIKLVEHVLTIYLKYLEHIYISNHSPSHFFDQPSSNPPRGEEIGVEHLERFYSLWVLLLMVDNGLWLSTPLRKTLQP